MSAKVRANPARDAGEAWAAKLSDVARRAVRYAITSHGRREPIPPDRLAAAALGRGVLSYSAADEYWTAALSVETRKTTEVPRWWKQFVAGVLAATRAGGRPERPE